MNKTALKKEIIMQNNGKIMISINKAAQLMGTNRATMADILAGVDYVTHGRNNAHMYFIGDVVEAYCR